MPEDTTLQSVFDYAKKGPLSGGEFPIYPLVYATFVEHFPNAHPTDPGNWDISDMVTYSNGPLTLSQDGKTLKGEFKYWKNRYYPGSIGFLGGPSYPEDLFADRMTPWTVLVTVSDSGKVTYQRKVSGNPTPIMSLNASYANGLFIEASSTGLRSLSFTLGKTY